MSIQRVIRAFAIPAAVVTAVLAGPTAANAATQLFQGEAVSRGVTETLRLASNNANAQASAAGYIPSTQCVVVGRNVVLLSEISDTWWARVTIRCTN